MSGRFLTLPNYITGLRLLLMPPLAILIELGYGWGALCVLVATGVTDLLDGYLARRLKQESDVGRLMDPVADKIFLCVAVIFLVARENYPSIINPDPRLSPWLAVLLLSREFLVTGLRAMASSVGVVIAASSTGKIKTLLQFIGLGCVMVGGNLFDSQSGFAGDGIPLYSTGIFCLWLSIALSYWSMASYSYRVYVEFKSRGRM
jgi:CDP-diacylglycerol--glycerol-3-phosphate 3-phosphatidyltransferase